jgi:hypothetical protein
MTLWTALKFFQDIIQWEALVKAVMNLRILHRKGEVLDQLSDN